jgi:hypothetical protein
LLTLPPPAGVAQVPSPRQNVELLAEVPLLRFVTGRFPVTPVVSGKPVALVSTPALGVPILGVVNTGLVAKTACPVPVSSVRAARRLALEGVASTVATPVPKPVMPVASGNPVAFVNTAAEGVPRFGVTSVGAVPLT